jgi:hypothetical protein
MRFGTASEETVCPCPINPVPCEAPSNPKAAKAKVGTISPSIAEIKNIFLSIII